MNSVAANLEFISSYHKKVEGIAYQFSQDLKIAGTIPFKQHGMLKIVQYKDLKDWAPFNKNDRLAALGNKIAHMIYTGKADSVKPMLTKIATGRVKTLYHVSKKHLGAKRESLGKGHFRWNHSAITLTDKDIQFVKEYFEL